jgi:hypothetical protein
LDDDPAWNAIRSGSAPDQLGEVSVVEVKQTLRHLQLILDPSEPNLELDLVGLQLVDGEL